MKTLKANLHSHALADFSPWWKKQFGIEGRNLAEVVAEKCFEKGLEIYALTNDPFWNFPQKSRFSYMFEYARQLPKEYKVDSLGEEAFIIEKGDNRVCFLDGQSIRVRDNGREYELLTFGTSKVPDNMNFKDTVAYLKDKGLIAVAEHPFAEGHCGDVSEESLLELWEKRYIDAIEHNAKIAVPNIFSLFPYEKLKGYTKDKNTLAKKFAEKHGIPFIANDDSDGITHIGTAYTEFNRDKIRMKNSETVIQDLNSSIINKEFKIHEGYLNALEWFRYAAWIITFKDGILGLRERYNKKVEQK